MRFRNPSGIWRVLKWFGLAVCLMFGMTWGTSVVWGGGMFNENSSLTLTECMFLDNVTGDRGGKIYGQGTSALTLRNCLFSGNSDHDAGGVYNGNSSVELANCMFTGNSARYGVGVMNQGGDLTATNCTIAGNTGSGVYTDGPAMLINCIVWDNTGGSIADYPGGSANVTYST